MVAHTTQFAQPGWHFADGGGCTLLADKQGSAVSYISPSGKDISIVIETAQSNVTNTIEIKLTGGFVQLKQLHVWRSIPGAVFVELAPLTLTGGAGSLTVPAGAVVTLTSTTGQSKGGQGKTIPPKKNFTLPYSDDFDDAAEDSTPKYTSDMHGVFTAHTVGNTVAAGGEGGGKDKVLQQRTAIEPTSTAGGGDIYATILGDGSWVDYQVAITARLLPSNDSSSSTSATAAAAEAAGGADGACTFNRTIGRCGHLTQVPAENATTPQECEAACCAKSLADCETWQWCPKGVAECDQKWANTGRCWIGAACRSSDKDGWQTAARGPARRPPQLCLCALAGAE